MDAIQMEACEHGRKTIIAELLHAALELPESFAWEGINEDDALAIVAGPKHRLVFGYLHTPSVVDAGHGPKYRLSVEGVVVNVLEKTSSGWTLCREFGDKGTRVFWAPGNDLCALVRELVSRVLADPPFTTLTWKRCAHDRLKMRLFDMDGRNVGAIWRYQKFWGNTVGNQYPRKDLAASEVERAARFRIACAHQERLADLTVPA
jgi:hypothetical protein